MRKLLFVLLCFATYKVQAQTLVMNDETTEVKYLTTHLAGQLEGNFKGVEGTARFDSNEVDNAYIKLSFTTSSITTNDNLAGPNLIKARCFNPAKYPVVEITSNAISKLAPGKYQFKGVLIIKGITKPVTFPFTASANAGGYDFNFSFSFVKKNFGLHCGATGRRFKLVVRAYAKEGKQA